MQKILYTPSGSLPLLDIRAIPLRISGEDIKQSSLGGKSPQNRLGLSKIGLGKFGKKVWGSRKKLGVQNWMKRILRKGWGSREKVGCLEKWLG